MYEKVDSILPPVAILAGGLATRLYPITKTIPKAMLPVDGRPFIAHQLDLLNRHGVSRVVMCVGNMADMIMDYVKDGMQFGLRVEYSFDGDRLLGTGGAISKALPLLGDMFFVLYGDSYLNISYRDIYQYFITQDRPALMTIFKNDGRWDKSNVIFSDGEILKYDKKNCSAQMQYVDYGVALLKSPVFNTVADGDFFDISSLYSRLVDSALMANFVATERFYEIGSMEGLSDLEMHIKNTRRK